MNEGDQTQGGQRPPQRHPGRNPEHGSPRQTEENMDFGVIAKLIKSSPEEAREALKLVTDMMGKAQAKELRESRREETSVYQISPEGLAKDISKGVNTNIIKNETIKQRLSTLLNNEKIIPSDPGRVSPVVLNIAIGQLQDILHDSYADPVAKEQIETIINNLIEISATFSMGRDELGAMAFTFSGPEIKLLTSGIEGAREALEYWVSSIEKTNHSSESDLNRTFNHNYTAAIGWLPILAARNYFTHVKINGEIITDTKKIGEAFDELIKEYKTRIHTHNMKWAIEQHDWKIIQAMANEYSSAALFEGFKLKNVSVAFNLFQRYFDRYRFVYGTAVDKNPDGTVKETYEDGVALWRINPEIVAKIRHDVENDLCNNREFYGISAKDEKTARNEAERVANIGLNLFSASMREGVHVARGQVIRKDMVNDLPGYNRDLTKEPPFQSDPNELLAVLYNPLQFALEKWSKYTGPQKILFDKIIAYLGKGDIVAGRQEFNNLLAIVDFFSSGWRIENVYTSTEARLKRFGKAGETGDQRKARLDSLSTGLLLQWKNPFRKDADEAKQAVNLKEGKEKLRLTAKYRPLELLKAYAVTIDQEGKKYSTGGVQNKFQEILESGQVKTTGGLVIDNYVRLEEILGRYLYPIYEKAMQAGWDTIHGIDIGNAGNDPSNPFSASDKQLIAETVDKINKRGGFDESQRLEVEDLQSLYKKMQDFLLENETIDDLATNVKHSHLYNRALYTDDAPLGRLEERIERVEGVSEEIVPISEKLFTSEGGRRDPVARMWGDTSSAAMVLESGMNAMVARDPESLIKALQEAMGAQTGYAGRAPYLKFLYSISGGWLNLAKADQVMAFFNLHKSLPVATSEFQRLFGLAAPAESSQELRQIYEKVKLILGKPDEDAGGKELDQRIKKELGIQGYKIALTILSKIMLLAIIFILQQQLEEMSKEEE